jgi:uncharacterized membrane-anchored protein
VAVSVQIRVRAFHPATYWLTIIAITAVGVTFQQNPASSAVNTALKNGKLQ